MSEKRCPACAVDPDPRGWSACFACRELNRLGASLDLSDAHVDRVARMLYRVFDAKNRRHDPQHDFDAMVRQYDAWRPIVDQWRATACEAIRLGAVAGEGAS